jgi:hypothetical protein
MSIAPRPIEPEPTAAGWASFAGTALALGGVLGLIWGITAVSDASYFGDRQPLWASLETWGWIAIVLGCVQLLGAVLVTLRRTAGALIALVLGILGLVAGFLTIAAFPLWGAILFGVDALLVWAVTTHGEQFVR